MILSWCSANYGVKYGVVPLVVWHNVHHYPVTYTYFIAKFSNPSQIGTTGLYRNNFLQSSQNLSFFSHFQHDIGKRSFRNSACPLFSHLSLLWATQFLPSALSSDPLHDRIGGVNWNSHTVSHFHLFIYLYKSDLPELLIYSTCMQICIVFALDQGRCGNVYFKVGIRLFQYLFFFFFTLKLLPLCSARLLKTSSCPRSISR